MFIKKSRLVVLLVACSLVFGGMGVVASNGIEQITAHFNHNIKFVVDGNPWTPTDHNGKKFSPIVKDGYSYLPSRAIAEATGAKISWDGNTQTITITTSNDGGMAGIPYNDNSDGPTSGSSAPPAQPSNPAPEQPKPANTSSGNKGTLGDPVKFGTSYTYTDYYNYANVDHYSAKYTITLTNVTPITRDQIEDLGFKRPEDNALVDYVLVDMDLKVENATFKESENSMVGYMYLSNYRPEFWGVKTPSENYIIGGTTIGFEGSLDRNTREVLSDFPTVKEGESKSYSVSGKLLLPILKGEENYLVVKQLDTTLDYDDSFIYFRLK